VSGRYLIRPKADQDLDEQAYYFATEATAELGHRFLVAAHETFALLVPPCTTKARHTAADGMAFSAQESRT
jgi:hypothetical protein